MEFKLTKDERRAAFGGTLKVLRRPEKPDLEPGEEFVVSTTRGGKQILDRETGETVDVPKQTRLSITVKGWKLRAGSSEWEAAVTIHDRRESNRHLSNGLGGIPREPGLRTRWGTRVIHSGGEVKVVKKRVPTRAEQRENWTSETERGYGGRADGDRPQEADKLGLEPTVVPSTAVDDSTLEDFAARAEEGSQALRQRRRQEERKTRLKMRLQTTEERGMTRTAGHLNRQMGA